MFYFTRKHLLSWICVQHCKCFSVKHFRIILELVAGKIKQYNILHIFANILILHATTALVMFCASVLKCAFLPQNAPKCVWRPGLLPDRLWRLHRLIDLLDEFRWRTRSQKRRERDKNGGSGRDGWEEIEKKTRWKRRWRNHAFANGLYRQCIVRK